MRTLLVALPAVLLMTLAVFPAAPPRLAGEDAHDLYVLMPGRPFRLRLHMTVAGRPYAAAWNQQVARLFRYLDTDGDGKLSPAELRHAPGRDQWKQMTTAEPAIDPDAAPVFRDVADRSGEVRLEQLQDYYRASTGGPLQVSWGWRDKPEQAVSDTLWRRLDVDGDGRLSRAEIQGAAQRLEQFDRNEDEIIEVRELMGDNYYHQPPHVAGEVAHGLALGGLPFYSFVPGKSADALRATLQQRYPRVSHPVPVDLALKLTLDRPGAVSLLGSPAPGVKVHFLREGAHVCMGQENLQLIVLPVEASGAKQQAREEASKVFRGLDRDGNGFIDRKEAFMPPHSHVSWMRLADRNDDSKVSQREFLEFGDLLTSLQGQVTYLRVIDLGRSLYDALDTDGDGRLGQREQRAGWQQLAPFTDARGLLSQKQMPRQYRLVVGHGKPPGQPHGEDELARAMLRRRPQRGPVWFRKMDRNGDGDVSLREWLGTTEQFRQLDLDRDGLISTDEAEVVEHARKRQQRSPRSPRSP